MRTELQEFTESRLFNAVILVVIVFNAIIIGVETGDIGDQTRVTLERIDAICLAIYLIELGTKLYAFRRYFFKSGWNVFDFVVILGSLIPTSILPVPLDIARILRLFRVVRTFRLVSSFHELRVIVESLGHSVKSIFWAVVLLTIISYIYAVAGISAFGDEAPEYFGDIGSAFFTLFQFATIEGWPDIARGICSEFPWAWVYFVSYVFIAGFIVMNVIVGVIVNSVENSQTEIRIEAAELADEPELAQLSRQLAKVQEEMEELASLTEKIIEKQTDDAVQAKFESEINAAREETHER